MSDQVTVALKEGYSYQTQGHAVYALPHELGRLIRWEQPVPNFLRLARTEGRLVRLWVLQGYATDGSSYSRDDRASMAGALPHDALYQLVRNGVLPESARPLCDAFADACWQTAGMGRFRRWVRGRALQRVGGRAASPDSRKPLIHVPVVDPYGAF